MPTTSEKRALGFFAGVLLLGAGVRVVRASTGGGAPASAEARAALHRQIAAVDSARSAKGGRSGKAGKGRRGGSPTGPEPSPTPRGSSWSTDSAARAVYYLRQPLAVQRMGVDSIAPPTRVDGAGAPEGPPIDVDVAPASELERLPRIGPALARRIVADREANGPFGSLQALTRVRGIGPATARQLAPYVTFTSSPRQSGEGDGAPGASGGRGRRLRKPRSP